MACMVKEDGMRYYIKIDNGYVVSIGTGNGGEEITEDRYNEVLTAIRNKPTPTESTDYILREDLTWEEYEIEIPPEDDGTPEELIEMLEEAL